MHYVFVTGFRYWSPQIAVIRRLHELYKLHKGDIMVIHGDCPTNKNPKYPGGKSVDAIAKEWAIIHQVPYLSFPARWLIQGRAGGPIRNEKMVTWLVRILSIEHYARYGYEDIDHSMYTCLAFVHPDSVGTLDCIEKLKAAELNYLAIKPEDN